MSSICGICRPDGAPVTAEEIASMLDALAHWQADARGQWTGAGAGLGHLLLRTTAPSGTESLPAHDAESGAAITGDLRLDNRGELGSALGIAAGDLASCSDGQLVLRAYRRWGEQCVSRLLGDFAFAVWDGRERRLFCARDVFGVKPFYYSQRSGTLAFASEIKGLLALDFVDRAVDPTWIGDYLHRVVLDRVGTFYAHIRRLEPAHALAFDAGGVRLRRYHTLGRIAAPRFARDEEAVEAFREKLVVAVRRRADTPFGVGAELSGGLDSSGICAVAQRVLRAEGRELLTYSQVRAEGMRDADDVPPDYRWAIESLCRHAGITRARLLAGEGGILSALDWVNGHHDEPPRDSSSVYNHGLYEMAAGEGVRVLLSGFAGNHCVSAGASERRHELLWSGRWMEMWRELRAEGGRHPLLKTVRLALRALDGPLLDVVRRRYVVWQAYPTRPTTDAFARRIGMWRRTLRSTLRNVGGGSLRARAIHALGTPGLPARLEDANLPTAARRIEYRYPLLDVELVELYLALPSRLKYWRGTGRYVFRKSLEGWLPDDVRLASGRRASSNPGNMARKLRDQDALKARLAALPPDSPVFGYFDPNKLVAVPRVRGRRPRERHTDILRVLALEHMLRRALEGRPAAR